MGLLAKPTSYTVSFGTKSLSNIAILQWNYIQQLNSNIDLSLLPLTTVKKLLPNPALGGTEHNPNIQILPFLSFFMEQPHKFSNPLLFLLSVGGDGAPGSGIYFFFGFIFKYLVDTLQVAVKPISYLELMLMKNVH